MKDLLFLWRKIVFSFEVIEEIIKENIERW